MATIKPVAAAAVSVKREPCSWCVLRRAAGGGQGHRYGHLEQIELGMVENVTVSGLQGPRQSLLNMEESM